jgi:hypothetical protein
MIRNGSDWLRSIARPVDDRAVKANLAIRNPELEDSGIGSGGSAPPPPTAFRGRQPFELLSLRIHPIKPALLQARTRFFR